MRYLFNVLILVGGVSGCHAAMADTPIPGGQANVVCSYSHTLPDDPILYPGKPGIAMSHDFFGNTSANGNTTGASLLANPNSTCENVADATAYWAPSLKLADGRIIKPEYQKTYYSNQAAPSPNNYVVQPFPAGIQMLAGNHMGTAPNSNISFLCTGRGYTGTIPTDCVPDPAAGTQLNIGVTFPTCWDGVNLAPMVMKGGPDNMAYPDASGTCPAGYPVRLPRINFSVAYKTGNVTDFTGAQLSMDPTLDAQGNVTELNWGSLYSAHADFFNGWKASAAKYMVDYCLNKGIACSKEIAYNYSEAIADATVTGGDSHATNFGNASTLVAQNTGAGYPQSNSYMRFTIPSGASDFPAAFKPTYKLMIYGGNSTNSNAQMLYFYVVSDGWNENSITMDNAPACTGPLAGRLYLDNAQNYRTVDVTSAVQTAIQAGKTSLSLCMQDGTNNNDAFTFSSKEGANKPVLYLVSVNPLGV
ncbi:DUF1996 domain-containing protein [Scandinavium goeteborgense]|uniref:DUF1996 domain-containing protein n=1 Tax=Scandinavium goeteborgense TaxID=1851514 RepID=UPI00381050D2